MSLLTVYINDHEGHEVKEDKSTGEIVNDAKVVIGHLGNTQEELPSSPSRSSW